MNDEERRAKALSDFRLEIPYPRCHTGKVPWLTKQDAQQAADRLNLNTDGNGYNETFHCPKCGWWHNGRPRRGNTVH